MRRSDALAALLLLLAAAAPPEPAELWSGPSRGPVPTTLAGATVLDTPTAAEQFLAERHALPLDVAPAAVRPPDMAPGMPWLPPAHRSIPGSVWLSDAARDVLDVERVPAYLAAVAKLSGNDRDRFVMVYCHPNCWASWNAARRLVQAGYRHVAWFPPGIEGWIDAGLPFELTEPTAD